MSIFGSKRLIPPSLEVTILHPRNFLAKALSELLGCCQVFQLWQSIIFQPKKHWGENVLNSSTPMVFITVPTVVLITINGCNQSYNPQRCSQACDRKFYDSYKPTNLTIGARGDLCPHADVLEGGGGREGDWPPLKSADLHGSEGCAEARNILEALCLHTGSQPPADSFRAPGPCCQSLL